MYIIIYFKNFNSQNLNEFIINEKIGDENVLAVNYPVYPSTKLQPIE